MPENDEKIELFGENADFEMHQNGLFEGHVVKNLPAMLSEALNKKPTGRTRLVKA